jgi:hypothetical protein
MLKKLVASVVLMVALPSVSGGTSHKQKPKTSDQSAVSTIVSAPPSVSINIQATDCTNDEHGCSQKKPCSTKPPWTEPFWSNWVLVLIGVCGVVAAIRAGSIALRDLRVTLRPRLIIRRIKLVQGAGRQNEGSPWTVEVVVANTGGSRAVIIRSNLTIDHDRSGIFENAPAFNKTTDSLGTPTLEPGESRLFQVPLSHDAAGWQRITELINSEGREQKGWLYCLGFIDYSDPLNIVRSTGFYRKYVMATKRFTPISDPDYEYSD